MKGILERNDQAVKAFRLIANKTRVETSKEFIAMGAVLKFLEDLPSLISGMKENESEEYLQSKIDELNMMFNDERQSLSDKNEELNRKLVAAAKKIKELQEQNNHLTKKLDEKIEKEFSDSLSIDDDFDFNIDGDDD